MTIKIFHMLALISGAIATIFALFSSHNRIAVCSTFILIGLIFEVAILFIKPIQVKEPELIYSIKLLPSNYADGYDFDGIKWESSYEEYRIYFCNKSRNVDIHDLRISISMLGGIVQFKILNQEGCENLNVLLSDTIGGGVGNKDKIISPVKTYSNNIKVSAVRVFREGYFEVRLISKFISLSSDDEGVFEISYRFANADNNMIKKSMAHKILVKDKNRKELYIDINNPLEGDYLRSESIVFDKPLVFQKGSVSIDGQTINMQERTGKPIEASLGDLKFSEDEFKRFKEFIGKSIIDSAAKNEMVTEEDFPPLPPIKIETRDPDLEYSCFDNIIFKVKEIRNGLIYLDNKDQNRAVLVELIFNPATKDGEFASDFVKLNRKAKYYNIDHEISFYEFKKSLILNAKIIFINMNDNSIISQTKHFVPINIDSRKSIKNMEDAISDLMRIKSDSETKR